MSVTCDRSVVFSGYSGFLHQYTWPSRYKWNIVESCIKYHKPNLDLYSHVNYTALFNINFSETLFFLSQYPPPRGCAGGRIGTRFLHPRGTSPLKGVNPAGTPGYRNGTESFFGLKGHPSVVRDVQMHNQPVLQMRRK